MTATVQTHPLISVRSDATVQEAARLMADCSIGALGVLGSEKQFDGIITERDLSWFVAQAKNASATQVADLVNDFPVVVEGPINDADALERMRGAHIRHLIVHEDDDFRIVSMRDFLTPAPKTSRDLTVRDVMTAPAVACRDQAFFEEVAEILADRDISGMPVVDPSEQVVGVISERDLAHAIGGPMVRLAVRRHARDPFMRDLREVPRYARRAKDIMTTPPITVSSYARLDDVARLLRRHQINRVPVVDSGRLVGVVTRGDVLRAIAHAEHRVIDLTQPPVVVGSAGLHPGMFIEWPNATVEGTNERGRGKNDE